MENTENRTIPEHVALILDGNGRWAKRRGLPRTMGHKEGCVTVEKTVEIAARMGIRYLTVYGFSTENWKRSAEEVGALMQLFRFYMVRLLKIAKANNVRVKMIGERSRFDKDIVEGINRLEAETKDNTGMTFIIAVNYGGPGVRLLPGHGRDSRPGSPHPHQRGAAPLQLPPLAAGLHGDLRHRLPVAGFQQRGIGKGHRRVQ